MGVSKISKCAHLLTVLLVCALPYSICAGQRGGGTVQFGNHSIEIHLVNQRGGNLNVTVKVEILTEAGMKMAEAYTNHEEGVAEFGGFNDGYFQLRVSGPNVETVTQSFQITATEATHREYVRVDVKKDGQAAANSVSGGDPTVSAEDLSIPAKAREEFAKAMEAHANGDDKTAQASLERALEIYPSYVKALNNLGVLYLRESLVDKAYIEFSKAVEFDPKFAPGHVNLARVAIARSNYAEAEPELKKAIAIDPNSLNAMELLCSTEFARKEYDDALTLSRHVHQLTQDAQYADLHLLAAEILVGENKPHDAAAEYGLFLKENPTDDRAPKVKSLMDRLSK